MDIDPLLALAGFVIVCFVTATTGAAFRPGAWYERLSKPSWRPPNRLFAPVWTVLYLMIGVAGWLAWREVGFAGAPLAFTFYAAQLLLNAAWTPLFFGLHRPDLALFDIALLWLAIAGTILGFAAIHTGAALLLVPYLAWVSFATALNFAIWRRNPARPA